MEENVAEKLEELKKDDNISEACEFCRKVLQTEENRTCLRFLAEQARRAGDRDNELVFLKRLLGTEVKKGDVVLRLMELTDKSDEMKEQVIEELISEKRDSEAEEIFLQMTENGWFDHEKILKWAERLSNSGKSKTAYDWVFYVIEVYKKMSLWEEMEKILAFCWKINPCEEVRKNLLICLREKFKNCRHLEYFLEELNVHSRKDVTSVLDKLQEILRYDEGKWVFHDSWGLGRVREMIPYQDELVIDFENKKGHVMNLGGAEKIIEPLNDEHWTVISKTQKEKLSVLIKENPVQVVKMYLKSFSGQAFGQDIKNDISNSLGIKDSWWNSSRDRIKNDGFIDYSAGGKGGVFSLIIKQKKKKQTNDKDFVYDGDIEAHYRKLTGFLQSVKKEGATNENEKKASEYFSAVKGELEKASALTRLKFHYLSVELQKHFKKFEVTELDFGKMSDKEVIEIIESPVKTDLKEKLIRNLKNSSRIDDDLRKQILCAKSFGFRDALPLETRAKDMAYIFERPFESPEALLWAAEKVKSGEVDISDRIPSDENMTEWIFKLTEKSSSENSERNKKIIVKARELLKRNDYEIIKNALNEALLPQAKIIVNWVSDTSAFNPVQKSEIRTKLIRLRPEVVVSDEAQASGDEAVYVSKSSFFKRQSLRDKLLYDTLPAIVEEIRRTAAMGDLSENFEYHAARAKHREVAGKISELEEQLSKTRVIDENMIDTDKVSIGTTVFLNSGEKEKNITILGPWDSDPESGIISYLSPLGEKLLGLKTNDFVEIEQSEFEVRKITVSEFLMDARTEQRRKLVDESDFRNIVEKGKTDEKDRRDYEERRNE